MHARVAKSWTMADFNTALAITLSFEGGYVDDPKDPGGETNHGITMRVFHTTAHPLLGLAPTSTNLKALTAAQAGIIYRANYWTPILGDQIAHQDLANILFDFYVNSGTHASSLLQTIVNEMGAKPAVVVDGTLGLGTLRALETLPLDEVYQQYRKGRAAYYTALGEKFPRFVKGWLKRVNSFPDLAGELAAATETSSAKA